MRTGKPVAMFGSQRGLAVLIAVVLLYMHSVAVVKSLTITVSTTDSTNQDSFSTTDSTSQDSFSTTDSTSQDSFSTTDSTSQDSFSTTDSTSQYSFSTTDSTSQDSFSTTDSTSQDSFSTTDSTSQDSFSTTDSTSQDSFSTTDSTSQDSFSTTDSTSQDSFSTTDSTSQDSFSTTDSTSQDSFSTTDSTNQDNITCSESDVSVEVSDNPGMNTCFQDIFQCDHPEGQVEGPAFSHIADGSQSFFALANRTTSGDEITICVNDTEFSLTPGSYEWILGLTYIVDGTPQDIVLVTVNTTVLEINDAPQILTQSNSANISEKYGIGSAIYSFTVTDPDAQVTNGSAANQQIRSVKLTDPLGGALTHLGLRNSTGTPDLYEVVITLALNASEVDKYIGMVVAQDGGGLRSSLNITFNVYDENEAPRCAPSVINLYAGVDMTPGARLGKLHCWDWDVTPAFRAISFSPSAQFSEVTVDVATSEIILNTTFTQQDVGTSIKGDIRAFAPNYPNQSTTVTVFLEVTRGLAPNCTPEVVNVTMRETDNVTQCQSVTLTCDLGVNNSSFLANYTSVYDTSLFKVSHADSVPQSLSNTVDVCPGTDLLGRYGTYDLDITVASELANSSYRWVIEVEDVNQVPEFDKARYNISVPESASPGSSVATIHFPGKGTAPMIGTIINITDPDTSPSFQFDSYTEYSVVGSGIGLSGDMYVVSRAMVPGETYTAVLRATDNAGAFADATVFFTVYDMNEYPRCTSIPLTINMTSSVGVTIFNMNCTDNDVRADYRAITYGEYESADFEYFSISDDGSVTLELQLPVNLTQLTYNVFARDGGNLTSNATLFVTINRDFGADCSPPSQVNATFLETDSIGTCRQALVTCVDSSGRDLPMTMTLLSDQTQGLLGVVDTVVNNTLVLHICVQKVLPDATLLLSAGQFEVIVAIDNTLASNNVVFNVTVEDLNQPPSFDNTTYVINVPENVPPGSINRTIAMVRSPTDSPSNLPNVTDIVRVDPDTRTDFTIVSVMHHAARAEYKDGTAYDGNFTEYSPITMSGKYVVMVTPLMPELVYFVTLTVRDGQGLSGNTTLEIRVDDVNESPSCPASSAVDLDLLQAAQTVVANIKCTDDDYDTAFGTVNYSSYPVEDHGFFRVEQLGDVYLKQPIPRDTVRLVLEAYAEDGGGLRDNTTLTFNIDRDHPPDCLPSYEPPSGVWKYDTCFRIYPNCSDPTAQPGDMQYLSYSFSGSWKTAFRENVSVSSTVDYGEFCYFLTRGGNFKIHMNVTNGLGYLAWEQDIVVNFQSAAPRFTDNRYIEQVNEDASVGSSVVVVEALVDGKATPLNYSFFAGGFIVPRKDGDVPQYFQINSSSGVISVSADLSPLAGKTAKTYVNAEDPSTGLNQSVPLSIQVVDLNDRPVCSPAALNVTVMWDVVKNAVIARVNCTDRDPTPGYSMLTYQMIDPEFVWTSDGEAIKLLTRANLQVLPRRPLHVVKVRATDGQYSATVTVSITVDRTPPKPVLRLDSLSYNNVTISWQFPDVYRDVINNFTVTIDGSSVVRPTVVTRDSAGLVNVTGLMTQGSYDIYVTANGFDGDVTSDPLSVTLPMKEVLKQTASVELQLTVEVWSNDLADPLSPTYRALAARLTAGVDDGLRSVQGFVKSQVRSFRLGSLYVDIVLVTNQSLAQVGDLQLASLSLTRTGNVGNVAVNPTYFRFYQNAVYINSLATSYDSSGKIDDGLVSGVSVIVAGHDVIADCSARTPGADAPNFDWTLGGRNVTSMQSSGRYSVSAPRMLNDTDRFKFYSTLTIRDIRVSESGRLVCSVRAGSERDKKEMSLNVVRKLTALLTPPSAVVTKGSYVSLTCTRKAGYELPWKAVLIRVKGRSQVTTVNMTSGSNHTVFRISARVNEGFECRITDRLSSASSQEANIVIRPPDVIECPANGDWEVTPAGVTVQIECPTGYADGGLQSRTCSEDGVWLDPDTSGCVRQDLQELEETVDQIEEGTTSVTTAEVVGKLENSTRDPLLQGDVISSVRILDRVANITAADTQPTVVDEDELKKYVQSADNVLHAAPDVWQNQTSVAFSLVHAVDTMGEAASKKLAHGNAGSIRSQPIRTNKIVLQLGRSDKNDRRDIQFPHPDETGYPDWVTASNNNAFLSRNAFNSSVDISYSGVIFRNMKNVISGVLPYEHTRTSNLSLNSPILALSLSLDNVKITLPVRLTFDHLTSNFSSVSCRFLDFSARPDAVWSTRGCWQKSSNSSVTVCECDHLTNFAVLMSPYRPADEVADVLSIFSIIGCSVSIFCLVLTLLIYYIFWRYVKSDRSVILVNLCAVLILAYVTFLAGVNRVEHEIVCTVVAALLHYLWLVVFFLMLCEGLDIFISIVIVFPIKSVLTWLLVVAYGVPLIIVGASLGITKLDGYGGTDFCWLSLDDGLLWAFAGPALGALLANFVFVALVIRALLSSTAMITKATRQRAKSILKAICVMTPILGLTWIFGVMSVNNDTMLFQILFVVFNSLQRLNAPFVRTSHSDDLRPVTTQGLMIFVLHCLLSKQVREGIQNRRRKYRAKSGSIDTSSNKYITQRQTSETTDNDLDKKTISPFLQADRQVQQMAAKVSRLDDPNLMTSGDPPKVGVKDPVAEAGVLNIQLNESASDRSLREQEEVQLDPAKLTLEPEFLTQPSNLRSIIPNPSPQTRSGAKAAAGGMGASQGRGGGMPERTVSTSSAENNARLDESMRLDHVYGPGARLSDSTDKMVQLRPAKLTLEPEFIIQAGNLKSVIPNASAQTRSGVKAAGDAMGAIQGRGGGMPEGTTGSAENNARMDRQYVKRNDRRASQSSDNVRVMSPSPAYNDVPALAPSDRWAKVDQPAQPPPQYLIQPQRHLQQQQQQSLILVRRTGNPAQAPQPRPSSPRRMIASAESLSPAQYQPFAAPRRVDGHPVGSNVKQPPQVAAKPGRRNQEPPVDYW